MDKKDRQYFIRVLRDMLVTGGGNFYFVFDDGCSGRIFHAFSQNSLSAEDCQQIYLLLCWLVASGNREAHDGIRNSAAYLQQENEHLEQLFAYEPNIECGQWGWYNGIGRLVKENIPLLAEWCPDAYDVLGELQETFYPQDRAQPLEWPELLDALRDMDYNNFRLDLDHLAEHCNWTREERADRDFDNEDNLFPYVMEGLRRTVGEALCKKLDGRDSDYAYRLWHLSPGCVLNKARKSFDVPERPFDDERALFRFLIAVTRLQWLTRHDSLPLGYIPFIWTDKENVEFIRFAFDALPDMRMTIDAARLCWQERECLDRMGLADGVRNTRQWLRLCKSPGNTTLTEERLRHVWGREHRKWSNAMAMVCRDPDDLPALVLLQGLLTAIAHQGHLRRRDVSRHLRMLRHLVEQTDKALFAPRLKEMLAEARALVVTGHICKTSQTFSEQQKREEIRKQKWLNKLDVGYRDGDEEALILFENHPLLRGAVHIIGMEDMDLDHYCAFCELFNDTDADYRRLLCEAFEAAGVVVNDHFDTLDSLRRFLTADTEEGQTAKRQVMHDLLAEPARQFALVRQRANHYEPLPPDEKSYYNVYPTERTLYLNLFARRGFPTNET